MVHTSICQCAVDVARGYGLIFRKGAIMYRVVALFFACSVATGVFAQAEGTRMSREELLSFLPGAKVKHFSQGGSERRWTNEPDGTLFANSNNKTFGNVAGTQTASHAGTWRVNDEGKYCIEIDWKRIHEQWCAFIVKGADGGYYLNSVDEKRKIEFVTK